ncbi:Hypothetical predicted protein [Pelobates cultripes]|uniref:Uncharacterized protein n=1 Tax=Pelobates cultripes TaxID=61616 RepID=A0AAD1S757_PELCU|nr:Hypothetical predicted protein [Pelobates cultripes]
MPFFHFPRRKGQKRRSEAYHAPSIPRLEYLLSGRPILADQTTRTDSTGSGNNYGTSISETCSSHGVRHKRHRNSPAATTATQNVDRKEQGGIPCTKPRRTSSPTTTAHH